MNTNTLHYIPVKEKIHCTHCDEEVVVAYYSTLDAKKEKTFCCTGCVTVFEVLHQKGLEEYYQIKKDSEILKRRSPVENSKNQYRYMDDEAFHKEYASVENNHLVLEFYLEGIHCLACLWLIEKLPEFLPDVAFARLDMGKSVAIIGLKENGRFSNVARELHTLGYRPHPLKRNEDQKKLETESERTFLKRMAIAAAGSMNIMLYAISIYAGADGLYAEIFGIFTVLFAIPVMTYSAYPFYQSAYYALKKGRLNLDVPIAMALLIGFFYGLWNIAQLNHENYLDSLTALVFLLLITRYFLQKIQKLGLTATDLNFFYEHNAVLVKRGNEFVEIHPQQLIAGDLIKVSENQLLPVDGIVHSGKSYLNVALLNGESMPEKVAPGSLVYSGTENLESELIIEVTKTNRETRLGKILKGVENGWANRAPIVQLTDKVSSYFIATVFIFSLSVFFLYFLKGEFHTGLNLAITLLIVTCPCALALATPMTLTNSMSKASRLGIIIKNDQVVQKLSEVKRIYIDKTGTLTFGKFKLTQLFLKADSKENHALFKSIVLGLEKNSRHPVANALKESFLGEGITSYKLDEIKEITGHGIEGNLGSDQYEIRALKNHETLNPAITPHTHADDERDTELYNRVGLLKNSQLVMEMVLADTLRPDSKRIIKAFKKSGIEVILLSGDNKKSVENVAREVGLENGEYFYELSPEDKCQILKKSESDNIKTLMVGDGANDAMALSHAYVGVAVQGAMDISLRASDVYLTTPGITPIYDLLIISHETMKVIYRNLVLSLAYNMISVSVVFMGIINPMIAAIVMPVSSLTVLFSTILGTSKLRKVFRGEFAWK